MNQDVLGFQIPVHHFGAMHVRHGPEKLLEAAFADIVCMIVLLEIAEKIVSAVWRMWRSALRAVKQTKSEVP